MSVPPPGSNPKRPADLSLANAEKNKQLQQPAQEKTQHVLNQFLQSNLLNRLSSFKLPSLPWKKVSQDTLHVDVNEKLPILDQQPAVEEDGSGSGYVTAEEDEYHTEDEGDEQLQPSIEKSGSDLKEQQLLPPEPAAKPSLFQAALDKIETAVKVIGQKSKEVAAHAYEATQQVVKEKSIQLIQEHLSTYSKQLNKVPLIEKAHQEMEQAGVGPQFIAFSQWLSSLVQKTVTKRLSEQKGFLAGNLQGQEELLKDLIDINLAKGFANLSKQLEGQKEQPSLLRALSLLCQKASEHLDQATLAQIEEKYRPHRQDLAFEQVRQKELNALFKVVADDLLTTIFPNKIGDLEVPTIHLFGQNLLEYGLVKNYLYDFIKDELADFLQTSYEPLEKDVTRRQRWETAIQDRVGKDIPVETLIQAPTSLLAGVLTHHVQTDPGFVTLVADMLAKSVSDKSSEELDKDTKQKIVGQLSQEELAAWLVSSMQAMLHTQDPHLLKFSAFIKDMIGQLTLATVAKGTELAIPQGKQIHPDHFIKELSDALLEKFKSLQAGEKIPDQFWKDWFQDLPLPSVMKTELLPPLIKKANDIQDSLQKTAIPILQDIENLHKDTLIKVKGYKNGAQLLSISEKITDLILNQVLTKNIDLVDTLGVGNKLNELLDTYLPGLKVDDHLKAWFKNNLHALSKQERGQVPASVALLKQAIQAVLLKALVNTVESNFKNDSEDYAAQVFQHMQRVFEKAFPAWTNAQKESIKAALEIEKQIKANLIRQQELEKGMLDLPLRLVPNQLQLIIDVIEANQRLIRIENEVKHLKDKKNVLFQKLDEDLNGVWKAEELEKMREMVVAQPADIPVEKLKLVSEALSFLKTLENALKEQDHLRADFKHKKTKVSLEDHNEALANPDAWAAAVNWMSQVFKDQRDLNSLKQEQARLTDLLDSHLTSFQALAQELSGLFGLDEKEKLQLPPLVQDKIWPLIEKAKQQHLSRLLFDQLSSVLLVVMESDENRQKLQSFGRGNSLLAQLIHATAPGIVQKIPDYVTSYKPLVKSLLSLMGFAHPTEGQIVRLEQEMVKGMRQKGFEPLTADDLKPLLKGKIAASDVERASQRLFQWVKEKGASEEQLLHFFNQEISRPAKDRLVFLHQEVLNVNEFNKHISDLSKSLDRLLIDLGRSRLTAADISQAYVKVIGELSPEEKFKLEQGIHPIEADRSKVARDPTLLEKIKRIVITPEEMAQDLSALIPGVIELQAPLAAQIQAALVNTDKPFEAGRGFLERYVEGMLLKIFVHLTEANGGQDAFERLTEKVKVAIQNPQFMKGKTREEAARLIIDDFLCNTLGLTSEYQLPGMPLALQNQVYKTIIRQAHLQLTPLLLPIIDKEENRSLLDSRSGSPFLKALSGALAKDLFRVLPSIFRSRRLLAEKMFKDLSGNNPTKEQLDRFSAKIGELAKEAGDQILTNKALVEAYLKVVDTTMPQEANRKSELISKLDQKGYRDQVFTILEDVLQVALTSEEAAEIVHEYFPQVTGPLQQAIADEIHSLTRKDSQVYQNVSGFAKEYVEGMYLRLFIRMAEKNPKVRDADGTRKDSLVVLVERLLETVRKRYQEARKGDKDFSKIAEELRDEIFVDILNLDHPDIFEGIPEPLRKIMYKYLKDRVEKFIVGFQKGMQTLDNRAEKARENLKGFGLDEQSQKAYADLLADELGKLVMDAIPHTLGEFAGDKMRGVHVISKGMEETLEELAKEKLEVAEVLRKYAKAPIFQEMLKSNLRDAVDPSSLEDPKLKAAHLVSDLLVTSMNKLFGNLKKFEQEEGAQFNRTLMSNVLRVAADHLKVLNQAKKLAAAQGRQDIQYADFVQAAGKGLHPAVPVKDTGYEKSIEAIKARLNIRLGEKDKEQLEEGLAFLMKQEADGYAILSVKNLKPLTELIERITDHAIQGNSYKALKAVDQNGKTIKDILREDANALNKQRTDHFYNPATKTLMKLLFPGGKKDLNFIPEELRSIVWRLFKQNLFPKVLPLIVESLLDEKAIKQIVANSLDSTLKTLSEDVELDKEKIEDPSLDELDQVSGELILELVEMLELPALVKKQLKNPKTADKIKQSLGAALRKQFNGRFLQDKLSLALESLVKPNLKTGEKVFEFNPKPASEKQAEKTRAIADLDDAIRKRSYEVADASVAYVVKNTWKRAQSKFDQLIAKIFGKVGTKIKAALDAVFGYIFFKIVGTAISYMLHIFKIDQWVKKNFHNYISLDRNREMILRTLTKAPVDQPGDSPRVVYHEDLLYKVARRLRETVVETLKKRELPEALQKTESAA